MSQSNPVPLPLVSSNLDSDGYALFEQTIADRIAKNDRPLFETDVSGAALWDAYLSNLPTDRRQHYNCKCCRRFIETYGGLVTIDEGGVASSLLWDAAGPPPPFFAESTSALNALVQRAKVSGVFVPSESTWGTPRSVAKKDGRAWSHLSGTPAQGLFYQGTVMTPSQKAAEKREEFGMLQRALADYPLAVAREAVRVLRADKLDRSEKALAVGEWFLKLHEAIQASPNQHCKRNVVWQFTAEAPVGFAHVRSTVISTLLDDVQAGLDFESISRRWSEKMHPLQYQRPQAAPSEGQLDAAEKLVEKLGIAPALERRFATLADVLSKLWEPKTPEASTDTSRGGVFGHLRPGQAIQEVALPSTRVTWDKFVRTVLSTVKTLECLVPYVGNFYGLVTAQHPDAPPILQWDGLEGRARNPVSHYVYNAGSTASRWGLTSHNWTKVTAVFLCSSQWQEPDRFKHHNSKSVFFALEGAKDSVSHGRGLALFPETLKAELHGVRAVVEAYSKSRELQGPGGDANGLAFNQNSPVEVRVDGRDVYILDRWD